MQFFVSVRVWVAAVVLMGSSWTLLAVTPPVPRSTAYNGAYSNIIHYGVQPWMNTNTVQITVEAWVFCNDLIGFQAFAARHYTTNFWFGLTGNHLRFYRSGGTFVDSDNSVIAGKWTHVAVTYDGSIARFYIDGVPAGIRALASAGNNCTNRLSLGGQRDRIGLGDIFAEGYAFNGYLDEVRLWSVARSESAIAAGRNSEIRAGPGLLATFGTGGPLNDLTFSAGSTDGQPGSQRLSGFGILPAGLCIPWTGNALQVDANIDLFNEYRGAETLVLRSPRSLTPDRAAYLMVCTNATNFHLFVGVPDLPQAGTPQIPVVQIAADVNVANGTTNGLGDWQCGVAQDSLQGGQIYAVNPPLFPHPSWMGWGQSVSNWQATTGGSFEFHQSYEFRIHARHLNYFTNAIGLLVRYYDFDAGGDQLTGPASAVTNQPATYARVDWCGRADRDLSQVTLAGSVTNITGNVGVADRTVSLYSGDSELNGFLLATTTTDAQGRFLFDHVAAPSERRLAVTYAPPSGIVFVDPLIDASGSPLVPIRTNSPSSVTFPSCPVNCGYAKVNFRYRPPGPVQITGVTPDTVPASITVRTSPLKTTAAATVTVLGNNFHSGVRVYFRGSGCAAIPPSFCTGDFYEANVVSVAPDGMSLVVDVPGTLTGVTTATRGFQIVLQNPSFASTGGELWNYGPSVVVMPPSWPQLYGFEFANEDDGPSWEEFEACYGDSIFATVPFTDIPLPGLRDPYYGVYFLVYMAWMDLARGSCSGFAATSRLMAEGDIPSGAFDRADSGDGVHGVLFPDGYVGRPPCDLSGDPCAPKPGHWTGFDLFQPFRPINIWGRIISLQGSQTSAEFLNTWLPQLHRPITTGPRRGLSVGDPLLTLNRVRAETRANLVILSGREFQALHTLAPYGVLEEQGLMDDLLTREPRAGFSLIQVADSNWPERERYIEVDRTQNTFRYLIGGSLIVEGAGLYYMPVNVFRGRRHALGPVDIAANLDHFVRVLHTGTTLTSLQDAAGGTAGWNGTNLLNSYDGAVPMIPPGFVFGEPDRFDRTMFLLPETNQPARSWFRSAGSNVFLHYALGGGDVGFGFRANDKAASNSVDGLVLAPDQGLRGLGLRMGAPVSGFGAITASRDTNGQSRVFILDAGADLLTPDLQIERDGFKSLTIRNRSAAPLAYQLNFAGNDAQSGPFEYAYAKYQQPGRSTVTMRLPANPVAQTITRELDTNNDGIPETVEPALANGQLRINQEAGLLAIRWRQAAIGESLEQSGKLEVGQPKSWSAVNAPVTSEGADKVVRVQRGAADSFYRLRSPATNCLSLAGFAVGAQPNPWETNGFKFEAFQVTGAMLPQNRVASRGGFTGLDVVHTMLVHAVDDCDVLHLDVFQTSGLVTFEAIGPLGTVVARQTLTAAGTGSQRVSLQAFRSKIESVRVTSPNALCLILNVCSERVSR